MKCSKCKKDSVIHRQHEGRALCRKHFIDSVDKTVRKTIRLGRLLPRGSHIALGLSSDKDSVMLLHQLCSLNHSRRDLEISVIFVDEGILGFRNKVLPAVKKIAKQFKVPLYVTSYKELFKLTIDEIALKSKITDDVCTYCRKLRIFALNRKAAEIKANCIALGYTMDDETREIVAKFFGYDKIKDDGTIPNRLLDDDKKRLRIIKPLSEIPRSETELYAKLKEFDCTSVKCPYGQRSFRHKVGIILDDLESKHAGIKFNVLRMQQKLQVLSEKDISSEPI